MFNMFNKIKDNFKGDIYKEGLKLHSLDEIIDLHMSLDLFGKIEDIEYDDIECYNEMLCMHKKQYWVDDLNAQLKRFE